MAFPINRASVFEEDLDAVLSYLVSRASFVVARNLYEKVNEAIALLSFMPEINAPSCKPGLAGSSYREQLVGRYAIVYRFDGSVVYLCRFFSQSQNYRQFVIEW